MSAAGNEDALPIGPFRGAWHFLSNFYPSPVTLAGVPYPTVEHAYQAARCAMADDREAIRQASSPGEAKRLGRAAEQVADWDEVREKVMLDLLRQKFSSSSMLQMLVATGTRPIVEENDWGDAYWGTVGGVGENRLGRLLEKVRLELRCQLDAIDDEGELGTTP